MDFSAAVETARLQELIASELKIAAREWDRRNYDGWSAEALSGTSYYDFAAMLVIRLLVRETRS